MVLALCAVPLASAVDLSIVLQRRLSGRRQREGRSEDDADSGSDRERGRARPFQKSKVSSASPRIQQPQFGSGSNYTQSGFRDAPLTDGSAFKLDEDNLGDLEKVMTRQD